MNKMFYPDIKTQKMVNLKKHTQKSEHKPTIKCKNCSHVGAYHCTHCHTQYNTEQF